MHEYIADIRWQRHGAAFTDRRYSRAHDWLFDGGIHVPASSSPSVVPVPLSDEAAVDPEEAFVAALSSCHMLWFLDIVARRGYVVDQYEDTPLGVMDDEGGSLWMTRVTLRPDVTFAGRRPPGRTFEAMHEDAHGACFLARSVRSEIIVSPRPMRISQAQHRNTTPPWKK